MRQGVHIQQLLHWRLSLAEREASLPPRGAALLDALRPWWERWPERFAERASRLMAMPIAYGYAMASGERATGYPVPVVIMGTEDTQSSARILYVTVRAARLRLRFSLDDVQHAVNAAFDVTFVAADSGAPITQGLAERAQTGEYRLEVELPAEVAAGWASLRVTERMPFRLLLEPTERASGE